MIISSLFKSSHEDSNEVARRLRDVAMSELDTLAISYGDIRISHVRTIDADTIRGFTVQESIGLGVRVLYEGHWWAHLLQLLDHK